MKITLIAAADDHWGIGLNGNLPWSVSSDLAHFRRRTMGKVLIMGRKTMETLPSTLTGRRIAVLSGSSIEAYPSIEAVLEVFHLEEEILIAGGAQVYRAALPYCNAAEITRIAGEYNCDTYMPDMTGEGWSISKTEPLGENTLEHWVKR